MKKELDGRIFFAVLAALVLVVAFFGWRLVQGSDGAGVTETEFRKMEAEAKAQGRDLRNDPMLSQLYYKYHPEEKPPAGQVPSPMLAPPPPRTGFDAGAPGPSMMPGPPPMRTLDGQ